MHNSDRQAHLLGELEDLEWDFVCLSEARAKNDDVDLGGGRRLIAALGGQACAGSAAVIHARHADVLFRVSALTTGGS